MGIQGLLPLLKECQRGAHIQEYKGQTLGIDAYVWLHRGAYGCAEEIATGQTTVKYIKYALHKIRLLRHHGVIPYVVFDGGFLPSKKGTETDRESRRREALAKARDLAVEGKHSQAREYYVKAVDVTPQMAYQLIKALIAEEVSYVVAPYEADAQLAYLEKKGIIDGIITEDSDLLVFGCRKVLFKLDADGRCVEIKRDNFALCREFSFSGWTDKEFRQMAILSGCDYLESIPGLGLKTAHRLMRRYKSAEKVIQFIRLDGQLKVSRDYEDQFKRAELTFLHQRVFCPKAKKLVYLEDLPDNVLSKLCSPRAEELRFIGPFLEDDIAHGIARGDLCPLSKAKMVDIAPDVDQHTAPYRPTTTGAKGTIKDFFGPAPAGNKNSTNARKRHALGEISSNNLFSMKKAEAVDKQALRARPVKSRFFTPATRQMPSKVDIVTIEDSGDDEARHHPQRHLDRATCTPFDHRLGASSDAAESFIGSTSKQANPPMTHARKGAQASLEDDTVMNAYPPPNYTSLYTGLENDLFPEALPSVHTGDRPKIASGITLPPMPVPAPPIAPQEEELDGLWECHALSSPNDEEISSRPRKLRRYSSPFTPSKRKRSSVEEMSENVQNCELLTSPVTDVSLEVTAQHIQIGLTKQVALPSGSTDLTDYSSPRSITRDVRQSGTVQGRNKHCADEAQGSEDSLWSDEAVTPDASLQIERSTCTAPKHSVSNRKHATALQRSDAVRSTPDLDDLPEGRIFADSREAGFDKRMTSVIAGWRQKFAPLSSKRKRQTRDISQMLPSQCHAPQHLLSPVRNRKQEACNLPPTSSPNVVHRPPLFSTNVTQDDVLRSTSMSKDGKTDRSRTSLSQSTARALEAFRFKPN